ncbi:hypothetical protein G5C51_31720 [Streptomyces sp. A7024]|uniref:Uncharacterized protein n=1 Tax=Streptomyces coryli TaxID=1128680 RepID=A0A6G4U8K6_9ACTN|nr:hypothetical protein [Streptomyces coryli]NGN68453.1 hypothetical protein [Streptomyces coryli]
MTGSPDPQILRVIYGDPAGWSPGQFEDWLEACDIYRAELAEWSVLLLKVTPRAFDALCAAARRSAGQIDPCSISDADKRALERGGYAADTDDCGHRRGEDDPSGEHREHLYLFRITDAGRAVVI